MSPSPTLERPFVTVTVLLLDIWDKRLDPDQELSWLSLGSPIDRKSNSDVQYRKMYARINENKRVQVALRVPGIVSFIGGRVQGKLCLRPDDGVPLYIRPHPAPSTSPFVTKTAEIAAIEAMVERLESIDRRLMEWLCERLMHDGVSPNAISKMKYRGLLSVRCTDASENTRAESNRPSQKSSSTSSSSSSSSPISTPQPSQDATGGSLRRLVPPLRTQYPLKLLADAHADRYIDTTYDRLTEALYRKHVMVTTKLKHFILTDEAAILSQTAVEIRPLSRSPSLSLRTTAQSTSTNGPNHLGHNV